METLERENETLKQEIKRVKDILSSYSNHLWEIRSVINDCLWLSWNNNFRSKISAKWEQINMGQNMTLQKDQNIDYLNHPLSNSHLIRSSSNISAKVQPLDLEASEKHSDIELESQTSSVENGNKEFKAPLPKRNHAAIEIVLNNNIPMNLFSIFLSLTLVACFMCLWFIMGEDPNKNKDNNPTGIGGLEDGSRFLNEEYDKYQNDSFFSDIDNENIAFYDFEDKDYSFYNIDDEFHFNGRYNSISGMNNFLDYIKYQRFNFFSKVEGDYLVEPENETLQIFKPDDNYTSEDPKTNIEKKLYESSTSSRVEPEIDYIEEKNMKYNSIESIIWDTSFIFSDGPGVLDVDELNYLHLLIKTHGSIMLNSSMNEINGFANENLNYMDDGNAIEVGWRVFSTTFTNFTK